MQSEPSASPHTFGAKIENFGTIQYTSEIVIMWYQPEKFVVDFFGLPPIERAIHRFK